MKQSITAEQLRSVLSYDAGTGHFSWLSRTSGRVKPGDIAGYTDGRGCVDIRIRGVLYKAHRLAWLYSHGRWPDGEVDHIDGHPNNNKLSNLRECSHLQNHQNRTLNKNSTTGLMGVTFFKRDQKWRAQITDKGKNTHLGYFDTPEEAYKVYLAAKESRHTFSPVPRPY